MAEKKNIHKEIQFKAEWQKCLNIERAVMWVNREKKKQRPNGEIKNDSWRKLGLSKTLEYE